jgi:hypothetical protein
MNKLACGERFDCRDLMQVLDHWHEDDEVKTVVTFGPPMARGHERKVAERYAKKTLASLRTAVSETPNFFANARIERRSVVYASPI